MVNSEKQSFSNKQKSTNEKLAYLINSVDGKEPSPQAKRIIHLYANGDIDYESAKNELIKLYKR